MFTGIGFSFLFMYYVQARSRVDLLTYQHELNYDNILPETIQRHDAIITLMDTIPKAEFVTFAGEI